MEDNDPHKRMRRFGELCGYFYGRRFFGLEAIMSDRDSDHMLLELQEARAEIDRLRELLRWRCVKTEPPKIKGKYYTVSWNGLPKYDWFSPEIGWDGKDWRWIYWRPIGPLPGGE